MEAIRFISDLWRGRGRAPRRVRRCCGHRGPSPVAPPAARAADGGALYLLVELLEDVLALFQGVDLELVAGVGDYLVGGCPVVT